MLKPQAGKQHQLWRVGRLSKSVRGSSAREGVSGGCQSAKASTFHHSEGLCDRAVDILMLAFLISLMAEIAISKDCRHLIIVRTVGQGIDRERQVDTGFVASVMWIGPKVLDAFRSVTTAPCRKGPVQRLIAHIHLTLGGDRGDKPLTFPVR